MIKDILLPEKIGSYYLFGERIIGFDIGKTSVQATKILVKGNQRIIEKSVDVQLAGGPMSDYQEQAAQAIQACIAQLGSYSKIKTALSSSYTIFKELKLPFIGRDKLELVVPYEVEPLLPFPLQEGIIDFIITHENKEEKSSHVLVVAVQNQYIAQHLALFDKAGVSPELVTIDLIALYDVYQRIPAYASKKGGVVLIEVQTLATRMAYIFDGQLRLMRTIPKGLIDNAKQVAQTLQCDPQLVMDHLFRFGLDQSTHHEIQTALRTVFSTFIHDISLTFRSFMGTNQSSQSISSIVLFGQSSLIKGLPELVTELLYTPCSIFDISGLLSDQNITAKNGIPAANTISTGVALPALPHVEINLLKKEFSPSKSSLFIKQIAVAAFLLAALLGILLAHSIIQIRRLKQEARASQLEVIETMKEQFPKLPEDAESLEDIIDESRNIVTQDEKAWYPFSEAARTSFLKYLLELTSIIDKDALGIVVEKITMNDQGMTLKAQVPGFDQLKLLERDLKQSKLFRYVEPQNDPKFSMTIKFAGARKEQNDY